MPFKISGKYFNEDWNNLNLVNDQNVNWDEGIKIITDRFQSRFVNLIELIRKEEFSGFLIMSIDCLLIETLMQFYLGDKSTEIRFAKNHWKAYRDFFRNSKYFNKEFSTNSICHTFYSHFRCGLLHQSQTKKESLIRICEPTMLALIDSKNVKKGLVIDRQQFHQNLLLEIGDYFSKLENNELNYLNENLRANAIKKMNDICS